MFLKQANLEINLLCKDYCDLFLISLGVPVYGYVDTSAGVTGDKKWQIPLELGLDRNCTLLSVGANNKTRTL